MKAKDFAELAQAVVEQMPVEYNNSIQTWEQKLYEGSKKKFESILLKVEELAGMGFGSIEIKLDKICDMYRTKESEKRFYSEDDVCNILISEGFKLKPLEDFYDAQSYLLIWHNELKQSNEKIGMNI